MMPTHTPEMNGFDILRETRTFTLERVYYVIRSFPNFLWARPLSNPVEAMSCLF